MISVQERRKQIENMIDWMEREYIKGCKDRGAKKIIPFKTMINDFIILVFMIIIIIVLGIVMFYR